jgi:hypothetical protein
MAKALDEVFGKRDRERAAKEKATLERIVKEEDERLKCVTAQNSPRRAHNHPPAPPAVYVCPAEQC